MVDVTPLIFWTYKEFHSFFHLETKQFKIKFSTTRSTDFLEIA